MSIKSFLDSAIILIENNRYEEALCLACIAVDACSANIYPSKKVTERYKQFVSDNFRIICEFGFPGIIAGAIKIKVNADIKSLKRDENNYVGMEQIIYHVLRCGLVHRCKIKESVKFIENTIIGAWNEDKFLLPRSLVLGLIEAAKRNSDS